MKSGIFTVLETREEPQKAVYYLRAVEDVKSLFLHNGSG